MSNPEQTNQKQTFKKRCKFPNCRKMVTNNINAAADQLDLCCKDHSNLTKTFEKPDDCLICCEKLIENCPLFPCYHWVCKNCIIKSGKEECPVCRQLVILSKQDIKSLNKEKKKLEKEKIQTQLNEDRQLAEQIAQEMIRQLQENNAMQIIPHHRRRPVVHVQHIIITEENRDEILDILNALDEQERALYLQIIDQQR
jgi:hypothetical protein